jgi:hypothetical protein
MPVSFHRLSVQPNNNVTASADIAAVTASVTRTEDV